MAGRRTDRANRDDTAPHHTIGVVSRATGLPLDTLRMWERRYGFPKPARDASGVRYFSEGQIEHLRAAAAAVRLGYRPGDILLRPLEEIRELLEEISVGARNRPSQTCPTEQTALLLHAVQNLALAELETELHRLSTRHGIRTFVSGVVAPLLERVGESWERGELEIYHERLLTHLVEREVGRLTTLVRSSAGPTTVLATLPQENHQLPLDLFGLSMASTGMVVHNLGTNVSAEQLLRATRALQASVIAVSATLSATTLRLKDLLTELALKMPEDAEIWVSGRATERLVALPPRVRTLRGWADLDAAVTALSSRLG